MTCWLGVGVGVTKVPLLPPAGVPEVTEGEGVEVITTVDPDDGDGDDDEPSVVVLPLPVVVGVAVAEGVEVTTTVEPSVVLLLLPALVGLAVPLLLLVEIPVPPPVFRQTIEPTTTVFVERKLGLLTENGRPPVPVPFVPLYGVQVMLLASASTAPLRYNVDTACSDGSPVYGVGPNGTLMVALTTLLAAPPWEAETITIAIGEGPWAAAEAASARMVNGMVACIFVILFGKG